MFGKQPTVFLRQVFWETITHRMESGIKRNDLIDILLELKKDYGDQDYNGFSKQNRTKRWLFLKLIQNFFNYI